MPARKPLGVYRRTTGDWFQHQRAVASVSIAQTAGNTIAAGLFNNDQGGRVCHILGITLALTFPATGWAGGAFLV